MHRLIPTGEAARPAAFSPRPRCAHVRAAAQGPFGIVPESLTRFGRASRTPATLDPVDLRERRIRGKAVLLAGEAR